MNRCDHAWESDQKTVTEETYRQHRCGQEEGHEGRCTCRYCRTVRR